MVGSSEECRDLWCCEALLFSPPKCTNKEVELYSFQEISIKLLAAQNLDHFPDDINVYQIMTLQASSDAICW